MEQALILEALARTDYGGLVALLVAIAVCLGLIAKSVSASVDALTRIRGLVSITSNDYKKQLKNDTDVSAVLKAVREEYSADRVLVLQYHNGVRSVANNHLLKVSATHEVLSGNAKSMINAIQQWPSNFIEDWNTSVFDNQYLIPSKESFAKENLNGIYEFLSGYGVDQILVFPITDSFGGVFGLGMVQLSKRPYRPSENQVRWGYSRFQAIGALLAGTSKE